MTKHNAANERIKRDCFAYLREAKRRNEASMDAVAFKAKLDKQIAMRTAERLSRATVNSTLSALFSFSQSGGFGNLGGASEPFLPLPRRRGRR